MPAILVANWWSLFVRGLTALALGVLILLRREMPLSDLVVIFFGYAMLDGILNLAGFVTAAESCERWGSLLLEGIAGIAVALIAVAWPNLTITGFIYLTAAWGLATGILEVLSAVRLRKHVHGEWLLALSGLASIALGAVMVGVPLAGASAIALWLGAYALVFGAILIALALRLRGWVGLRHEPRPQPTA